MGGGESGGAAVIMVPLAFRGMCPTWEGWRGAQKGWEGTLPPPQASLVLKIGCMEAFRMKQEVSFDLATELF